MIHPTLDDALATIVDTIERHLTPELHDEYAASVALTVAQLLRSCQARARHEGDALWEDNADLRVLLTRWRPELPAPAAALVDAALGGRRPDDVYPSVLRLQEEATTLRHALVALIEALPDPQHPARVDTRAYLSRQLARQAPWMVDAFTGPRR